MTIGMSYGYERNTEQKAVNLPAPAYPPGRCPANTRHPFRRDRKQKRYNSKQTEE